MVECRCLRVIEDVELLQQAQPACVGHGVEGLASVDYVPLHIIYHVEKYLYYLIYELVYH